ncbi:MAG: aminopeptidase [Nitrososphaeria archaeon]|nr:aminopeptidase [Nitrososphaeria archaeon]
MVDDRIIKLAKLLVEYSTEVKAGDKVQISCDFYAKDLALEVYKQCLLKEAYPWIKVDIPGRNYIFYKYASDKILNFFPEHELYEIKNTDVYIALRAPSNIKELANIEASKISQRVKVLKPISDWRIEKTRWCAFYYPVESLAQEAGMALEEFEEFVYNSCLIDWKSLTYNLYALKKILDKTDQVHIIGEHTDIKFSIKGRNAEVGDGKKNMPDGEVFTSVVEDSVNGQIFYDIPAVYLGNVIEGVRLKFKDGIVVEADAVSGKDFLKKILETDDGAKRLGEFGIGLNYNIIRPVKNILFDEKIGGTIHTALGNGYKETLSKNTSAIHWDIIKDLRKNGKIYFDNHLVMENGQWKI